MRLLPAAPDPSSRYRLLAKWASGGMADVYVARQVGPAGFDKIVAIKLLRDQGDSVGFRDMFLEEVRTAALLNHPCIVQTFDAGELGDRLYMTMEFVNGETLGRFARAVAKSGGRFPCELAIAIVRDLANALDYAHTSTNLDGVPLQLVHRDVSPSNVLVSFDGMVKLLDFGIAKVATQMQMTGAGIIKGKFSYMSPEQARGELIDQRSDIYSLGVVLWQLLTGRAAFHASSDAELLRLVVNPRLLPPSQAGAACSEEVDALVMGALAPAAGDRYQTAAELATALARYMARRAAGFDATKVIRGLMGVHFRERRERLAQLIRSSSQDMPLEDIDHLAHQPSLRTPTPRAADARSSGTAETISTIDAGVVVPVTVAPTTTHAPESRGRWHVMAMLAVIVAGAGYITMRETASPVENMPAPQRTVAQPAVAPPVTTTVTPAVAQNAAPADEPVAAEATELVATAPAPAAAAAASSQPPRRAAAPPRRGVRPQPIRETPARAPAAIVAAPQLASAAPETTTTTVVEPRDPLPPPPSPIDAGITPPAPERRTRPVETAGSLDAVPRVSRVSVDGSLPTSEIRSAIERAQSTLRGCYRAAARRASKTPALAIKISFEIDEARAARGVRITGDTLGVEGCVSDAMSSIRTRVAPDVGTVSVSAVVKFDPVED